MVSDRKKDRKVAAAAKKSKGSKKNLTELDQVEAGVAALAVDTGRSCTGVLANHPMSRDIHIDSFTVLYHGHELLADTRLELNYGRSVATVGPACRHADADWLPRLLVGVTGSSGSTAAVNPPC
jgi:hypothetical protein